MHVQHTRLQQVSVTNHVRLGRETGCSDTKTWGQGITTIPFVIKEIPFAYIRNYWNVWLFSPWKICYTNSNHFELGELVAGTKVFTTILKCIGIKLSMRPVPSSCRSNLSPALSTPSYWRLDCIWVARLQFHLMQWVDCLQRKSYLRWRYREKMET